jgi:hypothetical protein
MRFHVLAKNHNVLKNIVCVMHLVRNVIQTVSARNAKITLN